MMIKQIVFVGALVLSVQGAIASELIGNPSVATPQAAEKYLSKNVEMLSAQEMSDTKGRWAWNKISIICCSGQAPATGAAVATPAPTATIPSAKVSVIRFW